MTHLPRRHFLASTSHHMLTGGSLLTLGLAAGCSGDDGAPHRGLRFASLAEAGVELTRLAQAPALDSKAAWNWAQTLNHCAQSIEFSMQGYPQAKSRFFQLTAGAAAFQVFAWRGRMTHDLTEPIPGAPALDAQAGADTALARLQQAVAAFRAWSGPLQPHFAYGELSHAEYEQAHAMHLADHFSLFDVAPRPA